MLSQRKIKQILIDAEKAFGEEPSPSEKNSDGLCWFIRNHHTMIYNTDKTALAYQKEILGDKLREDSFTFCLNDDLYWSQLACWKYPELHHLKFERRDWCRQELKRRFNYEVKK